MKAHELANALWCRGRPDLAETTLRTAIAKHEQHFGRDTRSLIPVLQELASLLDAQDRSDQAEAIYRRMLALCDQEFGQDSAPTRYCLMMFASFMRAVGKEDEAVALEARLESIIRNRREAFLQHPVRLLSHAAREAHYSGNLQEAERLYGEAIAVAETMRADEPEASEMPLNGLAYLLRDTGRWVEAESVFRRVITDREARHGADDPELACTLSNCADVVLQRGQHEEAEQLLRRALGLSGRFPHCDSARMLQMLANLREKRGDLEEADRLLGDTLAHMDALRHSGGVEPLALASAVADQIRVLLAMGCAREAEAVRQRYQLAP
jgi:tetratricopeptide (TPR) repeat protein